MGILWYSFGVSIRFLCDFYGISMISLWDVFAIPVGFLWHSYGSSMMFL